MQSLKTAFVTKMKREIKKKMKITRENGYLVTRSHSAVQVSINQVINQVLQPRNEKSTH